MKINQYANTKNIPNFDLFCIQYSDNNAEALLANVTNIPFKIKSIDTHNCWNGNSFITLFETNYSITGSGYFLVSAPVINLYIDGVLIKRINPAIAGATTNYHCQQYIMKGKTVSLRVAANSTLVSGLSNVHNICVTAFINSMLI
jgi:hypothetical protein